MSEGERESDWMLVDLNDVVVHIFTEDARRMYRLEALWADQPQEMYEDEENAVV
jgi:ribosome-associated protein